MLSPSSRQICKSASLQSAFVAHGFFLHIMGTKMIIPLAKIILAVKFFISTLNILE